MLPSYVQDASALEIQLKGVAHTVSDRIARLTVTAKDSLVVQRLVVELNGQRLPVPSFPPSTEVEVAVPLTLQLGRNLITARAATGKARTSTLVAVTYDGGDDQQPPVVQVVAPQSDEETADSVAVLYGYAADDVKVDGVTVAGRPVLPWDGILPDRGTKDLSIEPLSADAGDRFAWISPPLPLAVGWNTLVASARDLKGRSTEQAIRLFRRPRFAGERWAVVVGVSDYRNGIAPLQYADDDARAFCEFLRSPAGGGFAPEKVRLLVDEGATTQALRDALNVFLAAAGPEDLVVFYFSGHGGADPARPDLLYFLTFDADPDRLASTAYPMEDVERALQRYVVAKRVLLLADACHSGGIAAPTRVAMKGADDGSELINRYLHALGATQPGWAMLSASMARERSQEGAQWGEGHGVFTYYLLKGMQGDADDDRNGVVTLGELVDYTRRRVQQDTKNTQHPDPSGDFDPSLPMSVLRAE
jgi:uncharacterized caspase-like protein